jgi:hypothetical protein
VGFDLSRSSGEKYLAAIADPSLGDQERSMAAMRLHMFPALLDEVLDLARDEHLPDLVSYWAGEAAYSLLGHRRLPVELDDFSDFAPGAKRRALEKRAAQQSVLPDGWDIDRVRQVVGADAELRPLLGAVFRRDPVSGQEDPIEPTAIIRVGEVFVCHDDQTQKWYSAVEVRRWWFVSESPGSDDLEPALRGLASRGSAS